MVKYNQELLSMVKKTIDPAIKKAVKRYQEILLEARIPVKKVIIFGSQAKGTAKPWSDIDVCVVSSIFGKDRHDERVRLMHLTLGVDLNIEPHPYNPTDLMDKWDPLAAEIRKYGLAI